jgi:hypothetical protein
LAINTALPLEIKKKEMKNKIKQNKKEQKKKKKLNKEANNKNLLWFIIKELHMDTEERTIPNKQREEKKKNK